jgi:outer membrane protein TolC
VKSQEFAFQLAKAQFRVGRGGQEDVLRAEETYLNAQNSLLDAEEAYKVQKDRFKIDLGVPIDTEFEVVEAIPEPEPLEIVSDRAVAAALANRLDLLTQREQVADTVRSVEIARNALRPDLNLDAGYTASSSGLASLKELTLENHVGTLGLTLSLPLERRAERNAYRASLIALDQARRDLGRAEDDIVLNIRSLVRDLRTQLLTIENERKNIAVLRRRITRASIDFQRGRASNRDIVEATDNLAAAETRLLDRQVAYHVSRLNLLQQMGLLFVDKEGRIVP